MKKIIHLLRTGYAFWIIVVIGMMTVFGAALALGMTQSTWFDEGYSILLAQKPVDQLIALTAVDAHPPLYYLLLKSWAAIFGWSEISLRASSAICGALAVGVMALLLRKLFSAKVALIALPFLVIAPFMLRYDYEIRMYALVLLIGVVSTYVLVKARESTSKKWWIIYGALVAIGMYTLYMSVVFWLAHVVWLLLQDKLATSAKLIRRPYVIAYLGAFVSFLPWLPTVISQLLNSALPPYMAAMTLREFLTVTGMTLSYTSFSRIGAWVSFGIAAWAILFTVVYVKVWRQASESVKQGLLLLSLCFIVGIVFYAVISLPPNPPRFMERYAIHISVYVYALLGVVVALAWRYDLRKHALSLGLISVILLSYGVVHLSNMGNYNLQRAQTMQARTVQNTFGCNDTTYIAAGPFAYIDMSYELRDCDLRFYYPDEVTFTGGYALLNDSSDRVENTETITAKRIIFSYFEESTEIISPDSRYRLIEQRTFDKTMIKVYERD